MISLTKEVIMKFMTLLLLFYMHMVYSQTVLDEIPPEPTMSPENFQNWEKDFQTLLNIKAKEVVKTKKYNSDTVLFELDGLMPKYHTTRFVIKNCMESSKDMEAMLKDKKSKCYKAFESYSQEVNDYHVKMESIFKKIETISLREFSDLLDLFAKKPFQAKDYEKYSLLHPDHNYNWLITQSDWYLYEAYKNRKLSEISYYYLSKLYNRPFGKNSSENEEVCSHKKNYELSNLALSRTENKEFTKKLEDLCKKATDNQSKMESLTLDLKNKLYLKYDVEKNDSDVIYNDLVKKFNLEKKSENSTTDNIELMDEDVM